MLQNVALRRNYAFAVSDQLVIVELTVPKFFGYKLAAGQSQTATAHQADERKFNRVPVNEQRPRSRIEKQKGRKRHFEKSGRNSRINRPCRDDGQAATRSILKE